MIRGVNKSRLHFLMIILLIFIVGACNQPSNDDDIEVDPTITSIDVDLSSVDNDFELESFTIQDIQLVLNYSDGSSNTITVTEAMIDSSDLSKLLNAGTHTITITYESFTTTVTITLTEDEDSLDDPPLIIFNNNSIIAEALENYAQEWAKQHDIEVVINTCDPMRCHYQNELLNQLSGSLQPDIFIIDGLSSFLEHKDKIHALTDAGWINDTDFAFTYDGEVYGFPINIEGFGMIYNKDILDSVGIDPASLTTLDAYEEAFKAIQKAIDEQDLVGVDMVVSMGAGQGLTWVTGLHNFNGYLASGLDVDDRTVVDDLLNGIVHEDRLNALVDWVELIFQYSDETILTEGNYIQHIEAFTEGRAAFIHQGNWINDSISEDSIDFKVGFAPHAFGSIETNAVFLSVFGHYVINKDGEHKELAKLFLEDLASTPKGHEFLINEANLLPAFNSIELEPTKLLDIALFEWVQSGNRYAIWMNDMPAGFGMDRIGQTYRLFAEGDYDRDAFTQALINDIQSLYIEETYDSEPLIIFNDNAFIAEELENYAVAWGRKNKVNIIIETCSTSFMCDYNSHLSNKLSGDTQPDIFIIDNLNTFLEHKDKIHTLTGAQWIKDTDFAFTYDGEVYGFPINIEGFGMAYNKAILDAVGIDPASLTNLEAYEAAFNTIQEAIDDGTLDGVEMVVSMAAGQSMTWVTGFHNFNGYLASGLDYNDRSILDDLLNGVAHPDRLDALADWTELLFSYTDENLLTQGNYDDQINAFKQGRAAFIHQGNWIDPNLLAGDGIDFEVGIAPHASGLGDVDGIFIIVHNHYVVNTDGNQTELAKQFLEDLAGTIEGHDYMLNDALILPAFKNIELAPQGPLSAAVFEWVQSDSNYAVWTDKMPPGFAMQEIGMAYLNYAQGEYVKETFIQALIDKIETLGD